MPSAFTNLTTLAIKFILFIVPKYYIDGFAEDEF